MANTTITLSTNMKYFATTFTSANLKIKRSASETKVAIAIPMPAFIPNRFTTMESASSSVVGMVKASSDALGGLAKFITFPIALIENKTSKMQETALA